MGNNKNKRILGDTITRKLRKIWKDMMQKHHKRHDFIVPLVTDW